MEDSDSVVHASRWNRLTITFATLATTTTLALGWSLLRPQPTQPVTRLSVLIPEGQGFAGRGHFDLSFDGSVMVYSGPGEAGATRLWARRRDALDATPIPDTDNARLPAISPDGEEVAFLAADGSIRIASLEGGASRMLTDSAVCCPRWSPNGAWVYYQNLSRGLSRMPAAGGPSEVVTRVDLTVGDRFNVWVDVLPGGKGVVYMASGPTGGNARIQAMDIETGEVHDLTPGTFPRYSATGHLLFTTLDGTTLMAAPFDADKLELTGPAARVAEHLSEPDRGWRYYAASRTGTLIYSMERSTSMEGSADGEAKSDQLILVQNWFEEMMAPGSD